MHNLNYFLLTPCKKCVSIDTKIKKLKLKISMGYMIYHDIS